MIVARAHLDCRMAGTQPVALAPGRAVAAEETTAFSSLTLVEQWAIIAGHGPAETREHGHLGQFAASAKVPLPSGSPSLSSEPASSMAMHWLSDCDQGHFVSVSLAATCSVCTAVLYMLSDSACEVLWLMHLAFLLLARSRWM